MTKPGITEPPASGPGSDLAVLASEAFVVGFPLVFDLEQVVRFTEEGIGAVPPTPFNVFGHARRLAGPSDRFVSINNDTVYSIAQIDLSAGPIVFGVPDSGDRYRVFQFIDAWTDNFAYVGTRSTGNGAGEFLLVPPAWEGDVPDGAEVIVFPTTVGTIVGRWAVDGEADLPAVHALQDALTLRPASAQHGGLIGVPEVVGVPAVAGAPELAGMPEVAAGPSESLTFFERMRVWSQAFPPSERDRAALGSYSSLGLTGDEPVADLAPEVREALEAGYAVGKEALEAALRTGAPVVDGWQLDLHVFDYNVDFFGIGTLRDPAWTLTDPGVRFAHRAAAALGGLWGNHGYEAAYATTYVDADGEALSGHREYRLRLHPTPPVGAFWSLTMYDLPGYFLVDNEEGRYSVGDRTPGLVYDEDGGVTITMSATRPADATAAANWLPAPEGPFRPMLRMYLPGDALLAGDYRPAPIRAVV